MVQRWDFRETEKRELEAEAKRKAGVTSCLSSKNRVAIVRGIIWNTNVFCQVKEKSGNSMVGQVNLGRTRKVREIETNCQKMYLFYLSRKGVLPGKIV